MRKLLLATVVLGVAVSTAWTFSGAAQKDDDDKKKPKYTIKEVMKKAHAGKDAILAKAGDGKATKEELKELVVMYESLAKNKPPKGELKDWEKRTAAMIKAAEAALKDEKNVAALVKLVKANCAECHKLHRPPPPKK
jgi:hypothetical protein